MDKFIEEAMRKANDANLMSDETQKHISELYEKVKISTMKAWRASVPESVVMLFCMFHNTLPMPTLADMAKLWEAFFVAGYYARNKEVLEEMANDGKGQSAD